MLSIANLLVLCENVHLSPSPLIGYKAPDISFYRNFLFYFPFPLSYSEIFILYSVLFCFVQTITVTSVLSIRNPSQEMENQKITCFISHPFTVAMNRTTSIRINRKFLPH